MKKQPFTKPGFSRREFLVRSLTVLTGASTLPALAWTGSVPPIVIFSKVYQALKLDFRQSAGVTAEAGLQGVDPAVRIGGELAPERVADDLPRYFEALRERGLRMPFITSGINDLSSPQAETVVRTAKKLGVHYYRLGFFNRQTEVSLERQIATIKSGLRELTALNREVGIGAVFQNHSPSGHAYIGGDLGEMRQIVSEFDPAQLGVAFDIGHAWVVHGEGWREHFEALKSYIKVVYVKDVVRTARWVPFGEGDIGKLGYFELLNKAGYHEPISMHIEFDWDQKGKKRTRETLLRAICDSRRTLQDWLTQA